MPRPPVSSWLLRTLVTAGVALLIDMAIVAAPAADAATGRWSPPERLSRAEVSGVPRVGLDARGNATALFTGFGPEGGLKVVDRPAGRRLSPPRPLPGDQPFDLAVAPNGAAVAAFDTVDEEGRYVGVSFRPPGGDFGAPERVPIPGRFGLRSVSAAMDTTGSAVVAWIEDGPTGVPGRVAAVTRSVGGGLGPAQVVSAPDRDAGNVEVATDRLGGAVVAFNSRSGPQTVVEAAVRPPAGLFGAPLQLSPPDEYVDDRSPVHLSVGEAGDAAIAWIGRKAGTPSRNRTNHRASVARRTPGGAFGVGRELSRPGASNVDVAVAPSGEVVAAWGHGRPGGQQASYPRERLRVASATRGRRFRRPQTLRGLDDGTYEPAVAIDDRGTTTVLWALTGLDVPRLQVARRARGCPFSTRVQLRGPHFAEGYFLYDLAVNPLGGAVALWDDAYGGIDPQDFGALSVYESGGPR